MQGRHIARGSTPSLFALSSRYTCRDITLLYSFRALSLFDLRRSPSLSSSPLLLAAAEGHALGSGVEAQGLGGPP